MLNKISKLIPQGKFKIPTVSILVTLGMLGLGAVGQRIKIDLTSQVIAADLPGYANQIHSNKENSLLSKLRNIRDNQNQLNSNNLETQNGQSDILIRNIKTIPTTTIPLRGKPSVGFPKRDGIYLYGQSATPNQLGQGCIVFQKQKGQVTGALYMPNSEFSCFRGTIAKSGQLAMTVTSSPSETGVNQVSTTSRIPRVTDETSLTYAYSVALKDFHQLESVSVNDRQILQACQQD